MKPHKQEPKGIAITFTSEELKALSEVLYTQQAIAASSAIALLDQVSHAQNELLCLQNGWDFQPFNLDKARSLLLSAEGYHRYRSGKVMH